MEYFITGATGFIGGAVANQLLDEGHEIVVLARTPSKATQLEERGAIVVEGDITDVDTLKEPMAGVDGVFHIAGWYEVGVTDPSIGERINVEGTRTVLETMQELDIPKGVYTSTLAVNSDTGGKIVDETYRFDGPHLTAYDRTKWQAHYEVAKPLVEDGLPLVTVMPGLVYGPGDTSIFGSTLREYLRGDLPALPRDVAFSVGHIEDIARAHLLAMAHGRPGEDYIIAGESVTLAELIEIVADIIDRKPPRTISPAVFRWLEPLVRVLERFVPLPNRYRSETLRILAGATYLGDNRKARTELGIEHRPIREGLEETVAHERTQRSS